MINLFKIELGRDILKHINVKLVIIILFFLVFLLCLNNVYAEEQEQTNNEFTEENIILKDSDLNVQRRRAPIVFEIPESEAVELGELENKINSMQTGDKEFLNYGVNFNNPTYEEPIGEPVVEGYKVSQKYKRFEYQLYPQSIDKYTIKVRKFEYTLVTYYKRSEGVNENQYTEGDNIINNTLGQANSFIMAGVENVDEENEIGFQLRKMLEENGFIDAIKSVGYLIFSIAIILLGIQYIFSGVEGKSFVKTSFITFSVGIIFFFLADTIYDVLSGALSGIFFGEVLTFEVISNNIFILLRTFANLACIIGIVILGLKYMISPANQKAVLKKQLFPIFVGLMLVFCTIQFLNLIISVSADVFPTDEVIEGDFPDSSGVTINSDISQIIGRVWSTFEIVVQIIALSCIVFTGVRYMFSSADKKADIKNTTVFLISGSILVFAAVPLINFIIRIIDSLI